MVYMIKIPSKYFVVLALFFAFSQCSKPPRPVTPETALQSYLDNGDKTFSWKVIQKEKTGGGTAWQLLLTSQKWRGFTWVHQLTVLAPEKIDHDSALLFITGGSVKDGRPNWKSPDDGLTKQFMGIAEKNRALVGESGSGKSTLARVIAGLLPPLGGQILFEGRRVPPALKSRAKEDLRKIQMIYQMPDTALNPRHKVRKIIGRPLSFYFHTGGDERRRRIFELLEMIELPKKYIDRYPDELSGGEKQRICIARALAAAPEVVICDEITSALDQLVAKGILELLQSLQNELHVSYLFITHDLATVKAIADEIVVMWKGKIVEQGVKKDILAPPYHEYTDLLLSSVPEMDPDWLDGLLLRREQSAPMSS